MNREKRDLLREMVKLIVFLDVIPDNDNHDICYIENKLVEIYNRTKEIFVEIDINEKKVNEK